MGEATGRKMNSFSELQFATGVWRDHNFPDHTADDQFKGMVEELGELAHANLKMKQGIRSDEDLPRLEEDAIGDLVIYLCGYCSVRGLSLFECVNQAWEEVKDRDWIKYPGTGRPPVPTQSPSVPEAGGPTGGGSKARPTFGDEFGYDIGGAS